MRTINVGFEKTKKKMDLKGFIRAWTIVFEKKEKFMRISSLLKRQFAATKGVEKYTPRFELASFIECTLNN